MKSKPENQLQKLRGLDFSALSLSPLTPTPLPLSLIDNKPQGALGWPPLLPWRRGTGRGGLGSSNPQDGVKEWPGEVGQWPNSGYVVEGLLSPTLSSKGGEGGERARPDKTAPLVVASATRHSFVLRHL